MSNLLDAFLDGCGPVVVTDPVRAALPDALARALATGREAWPGVSAQEMAFARRMGECATVGDRDPMEGLSQLRIEDLFLAVACAARDERACGYLQAVTMDGLGPALRDVGLDAAQAEDLRQRILARLVEPRADAPARIATYGGRASLKRWVRAVALREAQAVLRRRSSRIDDADVGTIVDPAHSPELHMLRTEYRDAFKSAFERAVAELTVRERNLLRQSVLDGLSVDELGALYGVHRSTAARWLERARARLLELTAGGLAEQLRLGPDELASMLRQADSQLHVSLSRVLGSS